MRHGTVHPVTIEVYSVTVPVNLTGWRADCEDDQHSHLGKLDTLCLYSSLEFLAKDLQSVKHKKKYKLQHLDK